METPIILDFETRSEANLRQVGGYQYAYHESTEILMLGALMPDDTMIVWIPCEDAHVPPDPETLDVWPHAVSEPIGLVLWYVQPELPEPLVQAAADGTPFAAHNADGFDRHVWAAKGLPEPAEWIDTLFLGLQVGLPASIDDVGVQLYGVHKDAKGKRTLTQVSRPSRKRGVKWNPIGTSALIDLVRYMLQDVITAADILDEWQRCTAGQVNREADVLAWTRESNARGVRIDRALCEAALKVGEEAKAAEVRGAVELVGSATALRSVPQFTEWLKERCPDAPSSMRKDPLLNWLKEKGDAVPQDVRTAIRGRVALNAKSGARFAKTLSMLPDDDRLRYLLVYHGSHTSRWASRGGLNLLNLPKGSLTEEQVNRAIDALLTGQPLPEFEGKTIAQVLASLVRPAVIPSEGCELVVYDLSQIEPRSLAWLANDEEWLDTFRRADAGEPGPDIYQLAAAPIFRVQPLAVTKAQRQGGKVTTLAGMYGQGAVGLKTFALDVYGIDLEAMNVSPAVAVRSFRDSRKRLVRFWYALRDACVQALQYIGLERTVGKLTVYAERVDNRTNLVVRYPSGRLQYYRDAILCLDRFGGKTFAYRKPTESFTEHVRPDGRVQVWHGALVENVTQAFARDVLADMMLRMQDAGIRVLVPVHDETIAESPLERAAEDEAKVAQIMRTPPSWAPGLPVKGEGGRRARYGKD